MRNRERLDARVTPEVGRTPLLVISAYFRGLCWYFLSKSWLARPRSMYLLTPRWLGVCEVQEQVHASPDTHQHFTLYKSSSSVPVRAHQLKQLSIAFALGQPRLHCPICSAAMIIQDILSKLATLAAPFHLLSYSFLTGMQLYQSFFTVKIAHRTLRRPAFTTLQARLFPVYFRLQSILLLLTALTYPPYGPVSLLSDRVALVSLSVAGTAGGLNLFLYGPRTRIAMLERAEQGEGQSPALHQMQHRTCD
jgi:hypothetical protein